MNSFASLFVQAPNDVIDLHEKRLRALENRVPVITVSQNSMLALRKSVAGNTH